MITFGPRIAAAALLLGASLALASASCQGSSVELCGVIPDGGCPIGRGGTCDDASCTGVYDCVDGDWKLVTACDGAGGSGSTSATMSTGSASSASGCMPASFDHTDETDGCTPDLEHPDCPIAAAELCNPCLTGCVDFFICTSTGWKDLAYCTEDAELVIVE